MPFLLPPPPPADPDPVAAWVFPEVAEVRKTSGRIVAESSEEPQVPGRIGPRNSMLPSAGRVRSGACPPGSVDPSLVEIGAFHPRPRAVRALHENARDRSSYRAAPTQDNAILGRARGLRENCDAIARAPCNHRGK